MIPCCADLLGQLQRVDGMDQIDLIDDVFDLIGLQMADHVPSDRLYGIVLVHDFLNLVLADVRHACINCRIDLLGCSGLADGDECNLIFRPARLVCGSPDSLMNLTQITLNVFHCALLLLLFLFFLLFLFLQFLLQRLLRLLQHFVVDADRVDDVLLLRVVVG